MRRIFLLALLVAALAALGGCKPKTQTEVPPTEVLEQPVSEPVVSSIVSEEPTPLAEDTVEPTQPQWETPTPIPTASYVPVELSIGSLWLKITAPPDNGIVSTPTVEVIGRATEGTVLTINEDIILVEEDQVFSSSVELDNGPNIIEVLASDINGDELYYFLTVYYEPEQQPGEARE